MMMPIGCERRTKRDAVIRPWQRVGVLVVSTLFIFSISSTSPGACHGLTFSAKRTFLVGVAQMDVGGQQRISTTFSNKNSDKLCGNPFLTLLMQNVNYEHDDEDRTTVRHKPTQSKSSGSATEAYFDSLAAFSSQPATSPTTFITIATTAIGDDVVLESPPPATITTNNVPSVRSRLADKFRQLTTSNNNNSGGSQPSNNEKDNTNSDSEDLNIQVKQGLFQIKSKEQHEAFLKANPDKLVVLKFKASYCRACAAIEPDFLATKNEPMLADLPIVWAECTASSSNKAFFRRLGVLSLPTVHFYDGSNGLVENFACGPAKIPILRQKLVEFLTRRVDPTTRALKSLADVQSQTSITAPVKVRDIRIGQELITQEHLDYLRDGMPFFQDLTDDEFDTLLSNARLETYLPGDIIIRQGRPGTTFFVVKSGAAEMSIRSRFEDPISTPPRYLGAVVNQLSKFDYFGERACTTGEPYAASIRVLTKTRCFAFDAEDIPENSILSKKRRVSSSVVDQLTTRYNLPEDYKSSYPATAQDECILELLVRFKQVRQAVRCFEYVMDAKPLLGDEGEIARRSMLVSKLSHSQRQDFVEVFNMADVTKSGTISLLEMRRFMEGARKQRSDEELVEIINKANPSIGASNQCSTGISLNEFMGVMAEAEFYYLFTETFQELDKDKTGYVRAGDLDEVLHGVRYLITEDRKSIIDVEDQDVQVDYEQFAKMLLGAAL